MTTFCAADRIEYLIASHQDELAAARHLVQTCYGRRGYDTPHADTQPGESTLLARLGDRVIGTVTVRSASRVRLQAEAGFAEHVGELRRQGRRLVEYTRFAIDRAWAGRHDVAAELIRRALLLGRMALGGDRLRDRGQSAPYALLPAAVRIYGTRPGTDLRTGGRAGPSAASGSGRHAALRCPRAGGGAEARHQQLKGAAARGFRFSGAGGRCDLAAAAAPQRPLRPAPPVCRARTGLRTPRRVPPRPPPA